MVLGIDAGTQALKAAVLDPESRVLGRASVPYPVRYPRPGWAEQDPRLWAEALPEAIAAALRQAGVRPVDVRALGITGQLDGCLALGRGGEPLSPCLIWMDRRAGLALSEGLRDRLHREGGIVPDPGHMAAKIRWLQDHVPGARRARFHQPVSYLVFLLTGAHVMDPSLASTTMLYSLAREDYEPDFLKAFGVSRESLPGIAPAESVAGELHSAGARLTGLRPGTPVAVGTGDDFTSPLGAGLTEPGTVSCVAGTAEVVGALCRSPIIDQGGTQGLVETHPFPGGVYFIENPGWLSGGAVSWLMRTTGLDSVEELNRQAAEVPAGSEGLCFLPALSGAMAPEWIPEARGCYYGLTPAHGRGHLARALLEGTAFAMRDVVERLRSLSVPVRDILFTGGGASSALWAQIRADVSGMRVRRVTMTDTTAVGAGMLASVAAGHQPDLRTCASRMKLPVREHEPVPGLREIHDRGHALYRRLFDCLKPLFSMEQP